MSKKASVSNQQSVAVESSISRITVSGYKSIYDEQSIEIRPLTILAGANSSGKSSMMQPLLLLKQTLEATYDPGPLLLDGPYLQFTSIEQVVPHFDSRKHELLTVELTLQSKSFIKLAFNLAKRKTQIKEMATGNAEDLKFVKFRLGMSHQTILTNLRHSEEDKDAIEFLASMSSEGGKLTIIRDRCFLRLVGTALSINTLIPLLFPKKWAEDEEKHLRKMIHLPGLRGNPERTFPVTAVGPMFPGAFQEYTASIIAQWQAEKRNRNLRFLGKYLEKLGLTWKVSAKAINDAQVELQVGRLSQATNNSTTDMVNIADVGVGVSQVLPVLVALLVAEPGQLVYIEEPEIHLHPRAQSAMAEILADAAKRRVRVVIETHSQLLLLGIQTLVANGSLSPDLVKLHWFHRRRDGSTQVTSADLDEAGAFGNWPEDFAEVALEAESRYLDAAESRQTIN